MSYEPKYDREFLLEIGDGSDGIEIYTSEDEAVVDWATDIPALYLTVSCGMLVNAKFGPFPLSRSLIEQLREKLKMTKERCCRPEMPESATEREESYERSNTKQQEIIHGTFAGKPARMLIEHGPLDKVPVQQPVERPPVEYPHFRSDISLRRWGEIWRDYALALESRLQEVKRELKSSESIRHAEKKVLIAEIAKAAELQEKFNRLRKLARELSRAAHTALLESVKK